MNSITRPGAALVLALLTLPGAPAQGPPRPKGAAALLRDNADDLVKRLDNDRTADPGTAAREDRDCFSGACCLRVTPLQRFSSRLPGWNYRIVEKPGPGEYRYVRFAWKKVGGAGIMVQFHSSGASTWNQRYVAGTPAVPWPALKVAAKAPADWEVVTRDLYKDFGELTLTGFALTPIDGTAGLFDHFYLGRTVEDLDRATDSALGRVPLKKALTARQLDQLWKDLASADVDEAAHALRTLTAGHKEAVPFLKGRLKSVPKADKSLRKLIADLDDADFGVREEATAALEKMGAPASAALRKVLRETESPEVRRRALRILKKVGTAEPTLTPGQLRTARAIRVLEHAGTEPARQVLGALAREALEAGLDEDARRALGRLAKRTPK
jgi:hypothetical protein